MMDFVLMFTLFILQSLVVYFLGIATWALFVAMLGVTGALKRLPASPAALAEVATAIALVSIVLHGSDGTRLALLAGWVAS
jgi:hypothetical protein